MNVNEFLVFEETSIKTCLKKIDTLGYGSLIVVNQKKIFLGVVTDGDLRRAILKKNNTEKTIKNFCNKKAKFFNKMIDENFAKNFLLENSNNMAPVLNNKNQVQHIFFLKDLLSQKKLKNLNEVVVIMAGGKGLRMRPFTNVFPKALLPFRQSTILEEIMISFEEDGYKNFLITTGFKSNNLVDYLKSKKKNKNIKFFKEKKPLGTIGGIKNFHHKLTKNFFLVNCDTYLNLNYQKILDFHIDQKNYLTIIAAFDNFQIEYGICNIKKNGQLINIEEKPNNEYLINTGSYVLNKNCLKYIKKGVPFSATELIEKLIKNRRKVSVFPIMKNQWKDVGNWKNYNTPYSDD